MFFQFHPEGPKKYNPPDWLATAFMVVSIAIYCSRRSFAIFSWTNICKLYLLYDCSLSNSLSNVTLMYWFGAFIYNCATTFYTLQDKDSQSRLVLYCIFLVRNPSHDFVFLDTFCVEYLGPSSLYNSLTIVLVVTGTVSKIIVNSLHVRSDGWTFNWLVPMIIVFHQVKCLACTPIRIMYYSIHCYV